MTHVLADTELNETQSDCVSTIQTSGESLMVVITTFSILEDRVGPADAGKPAVSPAGVVEDALDLFSRNPRQSTWRASISSRRACR